MALQRRQGLVPAPPDTLAFETWGDGFAGEKYSARLEVWNPSTLQWERMTQPGAGGGGGGIVQQGARDAPTVQPWWVQLHDGTAVYVGAKQADVQEVRDRLPAALDADGGLKVHQQNVPAVQPVSDNGGSLTVDGTVAVSGAVDTELPTPSALADNEANPSVPRVGGMAMVWDGATWDRQTQPLTDTQLRASAVPVSGPLTDAQLRASAVPVSIAATVQVDVTDEAARELGRTRIWDGTDEATVLPVRTQPATTEKTLVATMVPNRLATYACTTTTITPAITIGVKELLALWYTGGTKDIYVVEIWVTSLITTASTAGRSAIRVSTITSAPTGGTELTKVDVSGAGASAMTNTMQVKTGGGAIGSTFIRKLWLRTTEPAGRVLDTVYAASDRGDGIILRGGSSAGISIDIEREVAHTALVDVMDVGVRWLEL